MAAKRRSRRTNQTRLRRVESLEERNLLTAVINEVHFGPLFGDTSEDLYFELRGAPNEAIAPGTYMVVLDSDHDEAGEINSVFDLGGLNLGSNGYLVVAEANNGYQVVPGTALLQGTDEFGGLAGNRYQSETAITDRFEHVFGSTLR